MGLLIPKGRDSNLSTRMSTAICSHCKEPKPLDLTSVAIRSHTLADGTSKMYTQYTCKACVAKFTKAYRARDGYKERQKEYNGSARGRFRAIVAQAKIRDIKFDISLDFFVKNIFKMPCRYCGIDNTTGMDRVDNDFGYSEGNVVPCCLRCNTMKSDLSVGDFISMCTLIAGRATRWALFEKLKRTG